MNRKPHVGEEQVRRQRIGSILRVVLVALALLSAGFWTVSRNAKGVDFHECPNWEPCPCSYTCVPDAGTCAGENYVSKKCTAYVMAACKANNNFDCTGGGALTICRQHSYWTDDNCQGTVPCTVELKLNACTGQQQHPGGGGGGTP
jgi:hypothetical protein